MRNPFRSILNLAVAVAATLALTPVIVSPQTAYARGGGGGGRGGGGGGGSRGGSGGGGSGGGGAAGGGAAGGGAKGGAGKGGQGGRGGSGKGMGANGQAKNASEYLLLIQQDDSDDHRADFQFDACDESLVVSRDKNRTLGLAANREAQSRALRSDDMPRP